jgi:two-component system sensor histidine kinase KdpD
MEEMDVEGIISRKPAVCVVDELAHTNVPGTKHDKRYQDVVDLLDAGIHVLTAVNIQHLETLNDAVARVTGVRVRETVPDTFLDRADEVINIDVTVEELRTACVRARSTSRRKSSRRSTTSSAKAISRCASWRAPRASRDEVGEKAATPAARRARACVDSRAHHGLHEH